MTRTLLLSALAALTLLSTAAQAQPRSGMLLGVYAFQNYRGLRVTGTIPGYSAEGRIFRDDVLIRATTDGYQYYSVRSHSQIEYAKDRIGPYRPAALEIYRPGVGMVYMWVEFQPIGNAPAARALAMQTRKSGRQLTTSQVRKMGTMKAKIYTEREKPGAARLFKKSSRQNPPKRDKVRLPKPPKFKVPAFRTPQNRQPQRRDNPSRSAADLFGRR